MAIRPLVSHLDPLLRTPSQTVDPVSPEVRAAVRDLWETLATQKGVALAAPQIGLSLRLFVFDLKRPREKGGPPVRGLLVNPKVESRSGSLPVVEGCLSFPGLDLAIRRPERVVVSGYDLDGKKIVLEGGGLFARMVEHETDHLDGRLLPDRQSALTALLSYWRKRRWESRRKELR
ncbi:MAG: peptide deformylase [Leptospirillia bacterium]